MIIVFWTSSLMVDGSCIFYQRIVPKPPLVSIAYKRRGQENDATDHNYDHDAEKSSSSSISPLDTPII